MNIFAAAMPVKLHIPNLFTCANIACGCLALVILLNGRDLEWVSYLVGIAAVFDLLDGLTARVLRHFTGFGKQLDSLADMVSFGVVPGLLMFELIANAAGSNSFLSRGVEGLPLFPEGEAMLAYSGLLVILFSALRLAKFNIDHRQTNLFIGLPTPANALLIASFPLVMAYDEFGLGAFLSNPLLLSGLSVILSLLLVAPVDMFSLKPDSFQWRSHKLQYLFLLYAVIMLVFFHLTAITVVLFTYVIIAVIIKIRQLLINSHSR